MQLSRLSGRKVCDHVMRKGKVWKGNTMIVHWLSGAPRHPDVDPAKPAIFMGTFGSSRLSKSAVERNRMRRRCREAWRLTLKTAQCSGSAQLLVCPRFASLKAPFEAMLADVRAFLPLLPCRTPPPPAPAPGSSSTR